MISLALALLEALPSFEAEGMPFPLSAVTSLGVLALEAFAGVGDRGALRSGEGGLGIGDHATRSSSRTKWRRIILGRGMVSSK